MNVNKTFCSIPFLFQVIMQYILNLYSGAYQLCLDKTGGGNVSCTRARIFPFLFTVIFLTLRQFLA